MGLFDREAQFIQMLSTSLLTLNMPQLISEYGSRQFDVITSLDQHKVLSKDH